MSHYGKIERGILEIAHDEMIMKDKIKALLMSGPKTILELADELGFPSYEVTVWLFALYRYGEVEEVGRPDIDGYYQYKLVEKLEPGQSEVA